MVKNSPTRLVNRSYWPLLAKWRFIANWEEQEKQEKQFQTQAVSGIQLRQFSGVCARPPCDLAAKGKVIK